MQVSLLALGTGPLGYSASGEVRAEGVGLGFRVYGVGLRV